MRISISPAPLLYSGLLVLLLATGALGGVSGKISGQVLDVTTGEPVVGAIVTVVGTNLGTLTDIDGEYFIINLPSGKHNLSIEVMGYEPVIKTDVRVLVDLTTPVDFELDPSPVELSQAVIVRAENPIIQRDLTVSRVTFTADRIKDLPNMISVQSILSNYPGVVVDGGSDLHVRGGRAGQVTYLFDGFNIQDPFVADEGMHIITGSLEELSLTAGGYSAEYGDALSGIVNSVSQHGTHTYHGGIRVFEGATHPYDVTNGKIGGLERLGYRSASIDLSGPIPGLDPQRWTFFTAGEYLQNPSYLPHSSRQAYTGTAKLNMQPASRMRLKTNLSYNFITGESYDHRDVNGVSYDFNLDGLPKIERKAYLIGLTGDYAFSERTVLSASVNRFSTSTKIAPEHLFDLYWDRWPGYSVDEDGVYNGTVHENNYGNDIDWTNPQEIVGFTSGDDFRPIYGYRQSNYDAFSLSAVNQINKWNQIKTGFEYRKYNVKWDAKQFLNDNPYGEKFDCGPTYASVYIQNKMEYDYFIVNVGLRYDYRDADISYNATPTGDQPIYKNAESQGRVSPRLGVSFPISQKSVMHFNYGLYYQTPQFYYMYTNLQGDIETGLPLLGNPDLEPEQTVGYELGLDHMIGNNYRINVTAFYKDFQDLVTTRSSYKIAGSPVTYFDNDDYGSAKGIDLAIEKLPTNSNLSGSISYSYMIARGNGSDATEPYYTYLSASVDTLAPISEFPLDFDQRHTASAVVSYRAPQDWQANLLGLKLPSAWGLTFVGYYGSGLPYTPTDGAGNRLGERNEGRLPASYSVDMRFNKDFGFRTGDLKLTMFVEVDNLFNRRNVINVYSRTGLANNDGWDTQGGLALDQQEVDHYDDLYDNDPQNYSSPRTIRTGLELNF
ncbi:MAG: TonB-dependent receptor [candidate division Zixibacteria bacterium]|nr:TonB-dependent receptor [candidate division Zixibacteria bacterium]